MISFFALFTLFLANSHFFSVLWNRVMSELSTFLILMITEVKCLLEILISG